LRQQHWLKLLKDYDLHIQYHLGKANVIADALSWKTQHSSNIVMITQLSLWRELENLGIQLVPHRQKNVQLSALTLQPSTVDEIQVNQESDPKLQRIKENLEKEKSPGFVVYEDGTLRFQNHLCVHKNEELRKQVLEEAHNTRYSVHPGGTKMYRDLRQY